MGMVPTSNILAKSVFSTGPNDALATVDVYKSQNIAPVNSIQDAEPSDALSLKTAAIRGSQFLKSILPEALAITQGGLLLANATTGKQRILDSIGLVTSGFNALPDSYKSLLTTDPKGLGAIFATIGGTTRRVVGTNLTDIRATSRLLGDLSSNPQLVGVQDQDSTLSWFSTVANQASRTGMPSSFGALANQLQTSPLVNKLAKSTLPTALQFGDAAGLKDIATNTTPGTVSLLNPNAIGDFSTFFTTDPLANIAQKKSAYSSIMDAFSAVNTSWNVTPRNSTDTAVNNTKLQSSSADMKTVLQAGYMSPTASNDEKLLSLSGLFGKQSVSTCLATQYPDTVLF